MSIRSLLGAFWARTGVVSIRVKIMGILTLCIFISVIILISYTYRDVSNMMRSELQEKGIAIGTSLAMQGRDLILTDNQFSLYELFVDARDANHDFVYAFVLDPAGDVIIHTFSEGFPAMLLEANQVPPNAQYQVVRLQTDNEIIQDIAIPVLGGQAGTVHIGMTEAFVNASLNEHIRNILAWVPMILVLGLSIAYGLTSILTKPISQLVTEAQAVGRGDSKWRAPVWATGEVGRLGDAFNKMNEELKRKDRMRAQLLLKVINAQEDERKRVARELHDETGQALTSLMVGLKYIEGLTKTTKIGVKTAELYTLAAQTLDEVHHLAMELRPSLLDDMGLVAAVRKYTEEYSSKMDIKIDYYVGDANERRLPSEIEVTVYRIIQESLTNIAKHAKAKNVSIVLEYRDPYLVVIVEDDGEGFNISEITASTQERNLGLFGMHERANLIGGKLSVESQIGVGTSVFLEVPLGLVEEVF